MRKTRAAALGMVSGCMITAAGDLAAQGRGLYDNYGVWSITPKNPDYGLGAIMVGHFQRDGGALRSLQVICKARMQISPEEVKECKARQISLTNAAGRNASIDITASIKKLLEAGASARYVSKATLTVANACLFEYDLRESQKALEEDVDCLRLARAERRGLADVPLAEKLKRPGEYRLIWQTTRVLHGDVTYTVEFERGASLGVKAKTADELKLIGGSLSGAASSADKLELSGASLWIGLAPRYYEEWYLGRDDGRRVKADIERVALDRGLAETGVRSLAKSVAPEKAAMIDAAGRTVDAKIDAVLAAKKK